MKGMTLLELLYSIIAQGIDMQAEERHGALPCCASFNKIITQLSAYAILSLYIWSMTFKSAKSPARMIELHAPAQPFHYQTHHL